MEVKLGIQKPRKQMSDLAWLLLVLGTFGNDTGPDSSDPQRLALAAKEALQPAASDKIVTALDNDDSAGAVETVYNVLRGLQPEAMLALQEMAELARAQAGSGTSTVSASTARDFAKLVAGEITGRDAEAFRPALRLLSELAVATIVTQAG